MDILLDYAGEKGIPFKAADFYLENDLSIFLLGYDTFADLHVVLNIKENNEKLYWCQCKIFRDENHYEEVINNLTPDSLHEVNSVYQDGYPDGFFDKVKKIKSEKLDYFLTDSVLEQYNYLKDKDLYLEHCYDNQWTEVKLLKPII